MDTDHPTFQKVLAETVATLTAEGIDCDYAYHRNEDSGEIILFDLTAAAKLLRVVMFGVKS